MEIKIKLTRNILGKPIVKVKLIPNQWQKEKDVRTLKMGEDMKITCGVRPKPDPEHSGRSLKSNNPPIYVTGDMLEWDYNLMEV